MRRTGWASICALVSALAWPTPAPAQTGTPAAAAGTDGAGDRAPVLASSDEAPAPLAAAAWTTAGISVTLVLTGFIFTASANSREDDIRQLVAFRSTTGRPSQYQGPVAQRYQDKIEEGQRFETWARVAFVGAGLAAAGAATLFAIDARRARTEATTVGPELGPDRVGVAARWRF